MPPTTSGLETEWNYSGRMGTDRKATKQIKQEREKAKSKIIKDTVEGGEVKG